MRHDAVFWREDNATATLIFNGFDSKLALAGVLELARKQDRRIADAAESANGAGPTDDYFVLADNRT